MVQMEPQYKIKFHENAKKNFDEKANSLLLELSPVALANISTEFIPEFAPSAVINASDIVGTPTFKIGEDTKYFIKEDGKSIGLTGESFRQFKYLVDHIFRSSACRDKVSSEAIESQTFKWMEERYIGASNACLIDYLIEKLETLIKPRTVYVPIAATAVQSEVRIGQVRLVPLSSEIINSWQAICPPIDAKTKEQVDLLFSKKRESLQGYAIGIVDIEAEPEHAKSVATELVEQALSFLRVFSPVNADVRFANYTRIKGHESIRSAETIVIGEGSIQLSEEIVSPGPHQWHISTQMIEIMLKAGLETTSQLLLKKEPNQFQKKILDSLTIYSKSSLEHTPEGKLIYIFSSLEALLLKNESEPIQQNISERIAFLTSQDRAKRRSIIQNVKEAYGLRSKFFHHGHNIEEIESISTFMRTAWDSILKIISNANRYETKEQFISALEDIKLT